MLVGIATATTGIIGHRSTPTTKKTVTAISAVSRLRGKRRASAAPLIESVPPIITYGAACEAIAQEPPSAVPDRIRQRSEGLIHAVTVLRRRQEMCRAVDRAHPGEFFLADDESLAEVHLVSQEYDGNGSDLLADHLDPVVQIVERVLPGEVAHGDHTVRAFEVRIA